MLEDADDYEIIDAAKDFQDQLIIKKCELAARKRAIDEVMAVLVDKEVDISIIQKVVKEFDDIRGCEQLMAIKAGM